MKSGRTEKVVEKFTTILIRMETIIDVGLEARVYMAVVKFAVQNEKYGIYGATGKSEVLLRREQKKGVPSLTSGAINSASGHSDLE